MSHLQTLQDVGVCRAGTSPLTATERILVDPGEVKWMRTDWMNPVGAFIHSTTRFRTVEVREHKINWTSVEIDEFWLGHQAALLLLQGMPLSNLLIPNHRLVHADFERPLQVAHVVLRVRPWEYWRARPVLQGLMLVALGDIPDGLSPSEVLAALAFDSAA